ncbi:MAG: metal ABC transporter permease, partial [Alphaproteobacteria bacterium]|nr:metal ABC transporter permease [Alphaproteobacteria bacterium]
MTAWTILLPAFVMTALIAASHVYLGLHVLARGIIFVDLALAQVVALGASVAILFGLDAHGFVAQGLGLASGLVAAMAFAQLRRLPDKVSREVVIGCVYVVATALSVVILSRSTTGMEELKSLLNGSILWVGWDQIAVVAIVFGSIGAVHLWFRGRFHGLSFGEDDVPAPVLWEFLFFASFAVIITLAVNIVGILMVFAFLIIPAFSASLLAGQFLARLLVGWLVGLIGGAAGLATAYLGDLPVGA